MIDAGVVAYFKANINQATYFEDAPQNAAVPFIVIQLENREFNHPQGTGKTESTYSVLCFGTKPDTAATFGDSVITAVQNYKGPLGQVTSKLIRAFDVFDSVEKESGLYIRQFTMFVNTL